MFTTMKVSVRTSSTPLFYLFVFLAFNSVPCIATSPTDVQTLLSFKSSISDPNEALASWNNSLHFCEWLGVTCRRNQTDRVIALTLDSIGLKGQIPALIANLSFLQQLSLADNDLGGRIPEELGKLSQLKYLNLSFNHLHGNIPANLTRCSDMQIIDLYQNNLFGEILRDIGMLPKLLLINFGRNNLTGALPPSIGNLSSLQIFYAYENDLEGSIPDNIGRLSALKFLNLRDNKLSGSIPNSFYNLSRMTGVSLGINLLEGTLPSNLFNALPNLNLFYVYNNRLRGPLPASLPNASNLVDLQMRLNSFSGVIPSELGNLEFLETISLGQNQLQARTSQEWKFLSSLTNCSFLKVLGLDNNRLAGTFPISVVNLSSSIQQLGMSINQISGCIPSGIRNLGNLTRIYLGSNRLTGTIPESIGRLQNMRVLSLEMNSLTGQIPYSISNLTQLLVLYIHKNNLNGIIPESIGECKSLQELDLSHNKLQGPIPKQLFDLYSLATYLNLSKNLLSGSLPNEVGNLKNIGKIIISDNKLSGRLPSRLAECQSLEYLYLQGNHFQGTIPPSLVNLKGLLQLDVSRNNFTGEIPTFLQKLVALKYLNLSFNDFEGQVPTDGIFKNITEFSVRGNSKLCGGNPRLHLQSCKANLPKKQTNLLVRVLIPILSFILCALILLLIFIICCKFKKLRMIPSHESILEDQYVKVSYADLLRATDGFSASNLIGVGSFGSVYKGTIDKKTVAIKVLNLQQHGASKSFMTECKVLKSIRHRNLLKIITSCSTVDYNGNEVKALVLQYMPNGCLDSWLHQSADEAMSSNTLTLIQRLSTAIDVVSALDYLHHDAVVPIIHCDLKPSNVLLDEEMCAHLSDFGLARLLCDKVSETDENLISTVGIKGTIGYVAPEYGVGGQISTYGDIYSYGIILLELLTGKRPTNDMFKEGLNLHTYVKATPTERILDIVDPNLLLLKAPIEGSVELQRCIATIFNIGLECSNEDPRERMQIRDIIKQLREVQQILLDF